MARVRVTRVLVYEGEKGWVERTLSRSAVKPDKPLSISGVAMTITETERKEEEVDG